MKANAIQPFFLLPLLIAVPALTPASWAAAQTLNIVHTFAAIPPGPAPSTNYDGAYPLAGLVLSGNTLYGTAERGGTNNSDGNGTVFAVSLNGSNFTTLHNFSANGSGSPANSDGALPFGGLVLSGGTLYGTTASGGTNGQGTVFAININGSNFMVLHHFQPTYEGTNGDGTLPEAGLVLSGNTLYGTATGGGTNGNGTVFAVNTNGSNFTVLHTFKALVSNTNSDGAVPLAGLIIAGSTLYGTAEEGGTNGNGTVFAVNTNGLNFTTLHHFAGYPGEGSFPLAGLVLSGDTLYGTTSEGGTNANESGTIFAINTNGANFATLHNFNGTPGDGAQPVAGLFLSGSTLYGTTQAGGTNGYGTIFAVSTNGTGFTNLYVFSPAAYSAVSLTNSDGTEPSAGLILAGNTLYGTAQDGGTNGYGTVFGLALGSVSASPPKLALTPAGPDVILTWPTNAAGFTVDSATNLSPPIVWTTNATAPVVVSTNNVVTNAITGNRKFYRLSQ